jgi:hypothetical protein
MQRMTYDKQLCILFCGTYVTATFVLFSHTRKPKCWNGMALPVSKASYGSFWKRKSTSRKALPVADIKKSSS